MTDIEMMIDEIKKFQEKSHNVTNLNKEDEHLIFMCHQNTEKIIYDAIKENGLEIDNKYIHIFTSNYYKPGEVYHVMDKKIKNMLLVSKNIIKPIQENYVTFTTNYTVNGNYNYHYTYTTINKPWDMDIWG